MVVALKQTNLLLLVNHPDATLEVESPYNLSFLCFPFSFFLFRQCHAFLKCLQGQKPYFDFQNEYMYHNPQWLVLHEMIEAIPWLLWQNKGIKLID
jgi:hypothetical protein